MRHISEITSEVLMRPGFAARRSGKRKAGYSAKVSGNTEAQEFVASSLSAREEDRHEAARLPGGAREGNAAGMGITGKSRGANAPASREVEKTLLRLVADNRFNVAHKSRAKLKLVSSN